jgi:hypothetical protein
VRTQVCRAEAHDLRVAYTLDVVWRKLPRRTAKYRRPSMVRR